ncbi:hypothetical protein AB0D12_23790 [Streptomyces sp. NPDC048479]|uniref:hypothetical protein n=1 Tax=Streptomyces sp. NPDC048479 TaxID=3154725 RepID=UPI0034496609
MGCRGVKLVERREHRLIGNYSCQWDEIISVRSNGKKPLGGRQLIAHQVLLLHKQGMWPRAGRAEVSG